MKRVSVGVFSSTADALRPGAAWTHPVSVIRSATLGGSGCAVPGVGLPFTGLPPLCADTPAANAAASASTQPVRIRAVN
jgi:hypothetical protein